MRWRVTFPQPRDESLARLSKLLLIDEARGWKVGRFRNAERYEPEVAEATVEIPDKFRPRDLRAEVIYSDVTGFTTERHLLTLAAILPNIQPSIAKSDHG